MDIKAPEVHTDSSRRNSFSNFSAGSQWFIGFYCCLIALPFPLAALLSPLRGPGVLVLTINLVLLAGGAIVAVYASVPLVRLLLRMKPLQTPNRRSRISLALLSLYYLVDTLLSISLGLAVIYYQTPLARELLSFGITLSPPDPASLSRHLALGLPFIIITLLPAAVCIRFHLDRARLISKPYILFLRRFSETGDWSILAPLLRASAGRVRLAMLVEEADSYFLYMETRRGGNWDPLVLGFDGSMSLRPFRTVPIFFESRQQTWEEDVKLLITHATLVVTDLSHMSRALIAEEALVRSIRRDGETLWLTHAEPAEQPSGTRSLPGPGRSHSLQYHLASRQPFHRILTRLALGSVYFFGVIHTLYLLSLRDGFRASERFFIAVFALFTVASLVSMWSKPSISETSGRELRLRLQDTVRHCVQR